MVLQSVWAAEAALAWCAAMAAWTWKGPGRIDVIALVNSAVASAMVRVVPRGPVLLVEEHEVTDRIDSRRHPRPSEELERQQPDHLGVVGRELGRVLV